MLFESISELNHFKKLFPSTKCLTLKKEVDSGAQNTQFYTIIYHPGCNSIYIYDLILKKINTRCDSDGEMSDMEMETDSNIEWESEFTFTVTLNFSFPVFFIISCGKKVWVLGHEERADLNDYIPKLPKEQLSELSMYSENIQFAQKKSVSSIGPFKDPISCVNIAMDQCLIICRSNNFKQCYSIELMTPDQQFRQVAELPLPKESFVQGFSIIDLLQSGEPFNPDMQPYVTCIRTGTIQPEGQGEILTKHAFVRFFGEDTLCVTNSVILFAVPDGRVVWCPLLVNLPSPTFHLLCALEQPVRGIHIFSFDGGIPGNCLLIIGSLGKVLLLVALPGEEEILIRCFFIPPPVFNYVIMKKSIIYHVSMDGRIWKSQFENGNQQFSKNCMTTDGMSLADNIMSIHPLVEYEGLTLCISFDGQIYLGSLFSTISNEEKFGDPSTQLSNILQKCNEQSAHLQSLEDIKLKQKQLYTQLVALVSMKLKDVKLNSEVTIQKVNDKFFIRICFNELRALKILPEYWCASVTISRTFDKRLQCYKKTISIEPDLGPIYVELDSSFLLSGSCSSLSSLPLFIEVALILKMPQELKNRMQLKPIIHNFPFSIQLKSTVLHELYFLHKMQRTAGTYNLGAFHIKEHIRNNILSSIQDIYDNLEMNRKKRRFQKSLSHNKFKFPLENTVRLSMDTVRCFVNGKANNDGFDMIKKLIVESEKHSSNIEDSYKCFNHLVKIKVQNNQHFFTVSCQCECCLFLCGLKFSILYMCTDGERQQDRNNVTLTLKFVEKLELISNQISSSLCGYPSSVSEVSDVLNMYIFLRRELSSKLYF